ncbi:hypothetical protein E6C76_21550 [Pseudothauera nasutitermitis]|uniref:Uncharacterized protein n=1 Tax=Pseudothauera nasutitermitis TaxID=2565930 RepID=A0A4S4ANS1_9RHOO|nr:hypothetical protein [Pseudothauera nasutitermitis]THF60768.1 hypothetical protein E6C76_21550 [Pseudothauera nasutitermitis]
MRPRLRLSSAFLASAALLLCVAPATAEETDAARAERLKAEGKAIREAADARFAAEEPACYQRFQVNRCISDARNARLEEIRRAREVEAEARRLDLIERQRRAAELGVTDNTAPREAASPSTLDSQLPAPDPAAEALRREREAALSASERAAAAERAAKDAERAERRARAEADAAERAEKAERDRQRYEERIRKRAAEQR